MVTMELRDYLKIYWQQRGMIVGISLVAAIAAYVTAAVQPTRYAASESFAVNRVNKETTDQYQYDGYYALQAADLFSQTVVSWFSTPSVLQEIYTAAAINPDIRSVNTLPSRFKVKRYSAQNIVIRFSESTRERADKVVVAMRQVMEERARSLNRTAEGKSIFEIVGTAPVIAPAQPNPWVYGSMALILGFFFSLFVAAARHYIRE